MELTVVHKEVENNITRRLAEVGLHGLDKEEVRQAWKTGLLTNDQVKDYISYRKHPVLYHIKNIFKGAGWGATKAVKETGKNFEEATKWAESVYQDLQERFGGGEIKQVDTIDRAEKALEPTTTAGKIVGSLTQFLLPFIAFRKTPSVNAVTESIGNPVLKEAAASQVASSLTTASAIDPHDERLTNMLSDAGLNWAWIEYLKADHNDSKAEAKFKALVEDAFLGLGFEGVGRGVFKLLKGVKTGFQKTLRYFPEKAAEVENQLIKYEIPRLKDIEEIKNTPLKPQQPERELWIASREQTADLLKEAKKQERLYKDIVGESFEDHDDYIFRVVYEEDIKGDYLKPNPTNPHEYKGQKIIASHWTTSLEDALDIAKYKKTEGRTLKLLALHKDNLPDELLIQNSTDKGFLNKAWLAIPQDIPTDKIKTLDLTVDEKRGIVELKGGFNEARRILDNRGLKGGEGEGIPEGHGDKDTRGDIQKPDTTDKQPDTRTEGGSKSNPDKEVDGGTGVQKYKPVINRSESDYRKIAIEFLQYLKDPEAKIPETTYKGKTFFNFSKFEKPEDAVKTFNYIAEEIKPDVDKLVGGVERWSDVDSVARRLGMDVVQMKEVFENTKDLSKFVRAAGLFLNQYDQYLRELADKATTVEQELEFIKELTKFSEVTALMKGIQTNITRAFGIQRMVKEGTLDAFNKIDLDALKTTKTHKQIKKLIKTFRELKDPDERAIFARQVHQNGFMAGLIELVQTSLLSAVSAPVRNIIGSSLALLQEHTTKNLALVAHGLTEQDKRYLQAAKAAWFGLMQGLQDALYIPVGRSREKQWGKVWRAFRYGEPITDAVEKIESRNQGAIPNWLGGGVLRFVGYRLITVGDEFIKSLAYRSSLYSNAYLEGIEQGLTGEKLAKFVSQMIANPTTDLHIKSLKLGRTATFSNNLTGLPEAVNKWLNGYSGTGGMLVKATILPFFKVTVNIPKYVLQRSPVTLIEGLPYGANKALRKVGLMSREYIPKTKFWQDFSKGGLRRKEALTRVALGSAIMGLGAWLAAQKRLTGSAPKDSRQAWRQGGLPEQSIRLKDGWWIEHRGTDPVSMMLGLGASIYNLTERWALMKEGQIDEDINEFITHAAVLISEEFINKTYAKSVSEWFRAFTDADRVNWKKMFIRESQKFIPAGGLLRHIQTNTDEHIRVIKEWGDVLWSRLNSDKVEPARNMLSEPVVNPERFLETYRIQKPSNDPADKAILENNVNLKPLEDYIMFKGQKIELTAKEWGKINDIVVKLGLRDTLRKVVTDKSFKAIGDWETRREIITNIISSYRRAAKLLFLSKDKTKLNEAKAKLTEKALAIAGVKSLRNPEALIYGYETLY